MINFLLSGQLAYNRAYSLVMRSESTRILMHTAKFSFQDKIYYDITTLVRISRITHSDSRLKSSFSNLFYNYLIYSLRYLP